MFGTQVVGGRSLREGGCMMEFALFKAGQSKPDDISEVPLDKEFGKLSGGESNFDEVILHFRVNLQRINEYLYED